MSKIKTFVFEYFQTLCLSISAPVCIDQSDQQALDSSPLKSWTQLALDPTQDQQNSYQPLSWMPTSLRRDVSFVLELFLTANT